MNAVTQQTFIYQHGNEIRPHIISLMYEAFHVYTWSCHVGDSIYDAHWYDGASQFSMSRLPRFITNIPHFHRRGEYGEWLKCGLPSSYQ